MPEVESISLELLRPGPSHNQLLSPLTPYLAVCGSRGASTVYLEFEQRELLQQLNSLDPNMPPAHAAAQLAQIGAAMARLLSSIRSLPATIAEAVPPDPDRGAKSLVHLRLVSDAAELALLPFEAALAPQGCPGEGQPLLLQPNLPICLTREVRKPPAGGDWCFASGELRILFAYAELPGYDVPHRAHLLALRRAVAPWCDQSDPEKATSWVKERIDVLPRATLEMVRHACARQRYTHVHLLAHGRVLKGDGGFGLALHDAQQPTEADIIDGERLAETLRSYDAAAGRWSYPLVVTLAACDSGHQGSVIAPGGSLAHALHVEGVPLVIASQFPLSVPGSIILADTLYQGLLWGEDPRVVLYQLRRRLRIDCGQSHDWASLVVYASLPPTFGDDLCEFQFRRVALAIKAQEKRVASHGGAADGAALKLEQGRIDEYIARMQGMIGPKQNLIEARVRALDAEAADLALRNLERQRADWLIGAELRRAEILCRLGRPDCKEPLRHARRLLIELCKKQSDDAWLKANLVRVNMLLAPRLDRDEWALAEQGLREVLKQEPAKKPARSRPSWWAHAYLAELYMLALVDSPQEPALRADLEAKLTVEIAHIGRLVVTESENDLAQIRLGFRRYVELSWWSRYPELSVRAKAIMDALDGGG